MTVEKNEQPPDSTPEVAKIAGQFLALAEPNGYYDCLAGVDGGKVEGGAAMTSSNPVYKRRRLDVTPQPQVSIFPVRLSQRGRQTT